NAALQMFDTLAFTLDTDDAARDDGAIEVSGRGPGHRNREQAEHDDGAQAQRTRRLERVVFARRTPEDPLHEGQQLLDPHNSLPPLLCRRGRPGLTAPTGPAGYRRASTSSSSLRADPTHLGHDAGTASCRPCLLRSAGARR